ncbi:FtsW/RodA/SpoVE family cell cycle protein [Parvimonas micra]|uniref:FtsW/RodA/SpoVE family cell cycle protein n=1 Tax=Parvimonas micra TaxID=33033 RepID=UPI000E475682|nr:FtsW/RodA/SpoVE family cell cycle protein [Parvimonas micra]AXU11204.1 FtsW/RodA/SpoVE family cell cycle protein [Parvimonas micra]MEB3029529.1 FtsW/RodA/SpoVE family cell cycle protein [Parvimonas micra]
MISKKLMSRFRTLTVNSHVSTKSIQGLLLFFQILGLFLIMARDFANFDKTKLYFMIALIGFVYISGKLVQKFTRGDYYIMLIANMLFSIGILEIYRLNNKLAYRQIIWFCIGIVAFWVIYLILKYIRIWSKLYFFYAGISYLLFIATFLFGRRINGAKNWIRLGSNFAFQPSELIKIAFVFLIAAFYKNRDKFEKDFFKKYSLHFFFYTFLGFLFLQKDLGTVLVFSGVFIFAQYMYEPHRKYILINLLVLSFGAVLGYILFTHVKVRVKIWLDPFKYADGMGYQIIQGFYAIASGGFFGKGLGLGRPDYIPFAESDYIFASICEEMGILMGMGVVMLFLILTYRGIKTSMEQHNKFYKYVAFCLSLIFAFQSLIMFGGILKLIPLTGITIPFVSYGGSSILSSFIALGILQYASEENI